MKTTTRTFQTTALHIDQLDLDVELPSRPSSTMDWHEALIHVDDTSVTVGYLVDDADCQDPTEADYCGKIYECRRHGATLKDYERVLGLRYGGPDLDLVDSDKVVAEALSRIFEDAQLTAAALKHCSEFWHRADRGYSNDPTEDEDFIRNCLEDPIDFEPILDIEKIAFQLWQQGRQNGTIGDKYAVLLDVHEHGQVQYSLHSRSSTFDFDTARAGAVWVPSEVQRAELEEFASLVDHDVVKAQARALAYVAAKTYTDWRNGNCYGIIIVTYDLEGKLIEEDSCFGFIGEEEALAALKNEMPRAEKKDD